MDANISAKREKILYNSIYSAMSETVLALDTDRAGGSSSKFTAELLPPLHIDVDYKLALIDSDRWYS